MVQDVFVKIYIQIDKYQAATNFEAWIYKIAYNETMTGLRKLSKQEVLLLLKCRNEYSESVKNVQSKSLQNNSREIRIAMRQKSKNPFSISTTDKKRGFFENLIIFSIFAVYTSCGAFVPLAMI